MMDFKKIDYKKLYDDIINANPKIRLITICDINGKMMYSDHREGIEIYLRQKKANSHLN